MKKTPLQGVDRIKTNWYNISEQGRPIDGQPSESLVKEITARSWKDGGGYFFFLSNMYLNTSNKRAISAMIKLNNK